MNNILNKIIGRFCTWFLTYKDQISFTKTNKSIEEAQIILKDRNFLVRSILEIFIVSQFADPLLEELHHSRGRNSDQLFQIIREIKENYKKYVNENVVPDMVKQSKVELSQLELKNLYTIEINRQYLVI